MTGTDAVEIVLNGEPLRLPANTGLLDLLEQLRFKSARVGVELNRRVIPKAGYAVTTLRSGDRIEIVNFVGGG